MAKIALVTDIHFGARNDNLKITDFQEKFFAEIFFPYIKKHKIKTIVDLGDTFDRRKFINFTTLSRSRKMFFDVIEQNKYDLHVLVGNHDAYYRNTLEINSMDLLVEHYKSIKVYDRPSIANFDGLDIVMLPWICDENQKKVDKLIKETDADVLFGHLELSGYQMYKGQSIDHGMDDKWLDKFNLVCSGHYHTKSQKQNIHYLGCPYEMTWSDYDDPKGFHIFDTDTKQLQFIKNPNNLFKKIFYDDSKTSIDDILEQDFEQYKNCYVKVIIVNKTHPYNFDMFMEKLDAIDTSHIQVVDDHLHLDTDDDEFIEEAQDTLTLLYNYVSKLDIKNKNIVKKNVRELYEEALRVD